MVNPLALVDSPGNRHLLVFGPAADFRRRFLFLCFDIAPAGRLWARQTGNVRSQRLDGGSLGALLIRLQQGRKHVGGTQGNLRNQRRSRRILQRQHIFEFMCQFAEFAKAAGGRVPFQRVHRPAQAARRFRVARSFLQSHRLVVQLLDEFRRRFEKQLAKLAHSIFRRQGHIFTSTL